MVEPLFSLTVIEQLWRLATRFLVKTQRENPSRCREAFCRLASTPLITALDAPLPPLLLLLLHRNRDVCVPGNVNLVTDLDLIEHSRIDDTSAVFPSVWTGEGDR